MIQLNPALPDGWLDRGIILTNAGLFKEGMADYRQALTLHPDWGLVYFNMGLWHKDQNHIDSARYYYLLAIRSDSNLYKAHYNLGLLEQDYRKDTGAALFHYNKAIELNPYYTQPLVNRGIIRIRQGDKENGCADLTRAIQLGRKDRVATYDYYCR